jgi:CRP-like cAMP-binding protein
LEVIDGDAIASNKAWAAKLVRIIQPLTARADMLGSMPLFSGFGWAQLEEAAAYFEDVEVPRGARLTVQGRTDERLWLLVAGEALVSADARPLRVIGHGEAAGVAGMLYAVRSRETTIALSPIRALAAAPPGFAELVRIDPVRRRLTALAGEQLRARRLAKTR